MARCGSRAFCSVVSLNRPETCPLRVPSSTTRQVRSVNALRRRGSRCANFSLHIRASRGFREAFPDGRVFSPSPVESAIPALPILGGGHVARGATLAGSAGSIVLSLSRVRSHARFRLFPPNPGIGDCAGSSRPRTPSATRSVDSMHLVVITTGTPARGSTSCLSVAVAGSWRVGRGVVSGAPFPAPPFAGLVDFERDLGIGTLGRYHERDVLSKWTVSSMDMCSFACAPSQVFFRLA